jgi:hypothetical protein
MAASGSEVARRHRGTKAGSVVSLNILVLYNTRTWPMRASQRDHLWAFRRYAQGTCCFYVNLAFGGLPAHVNRIKFDLIVFDWSFVGARVMRDSFRRTLTRIDALKRSGAVKVTMPQDEFCSMDLMCGLINDFGIDVVFSVAPASEWPKLYRTVDFEKVRFVQVLTGYLDERLVDEWSRRFERDAPRPIDIGYRTVSTAIWGRFNLMKREIGEVFEREAVRRALRTDIAVGEPHLIMGDAWLRFLANCRYTLGIEGGSSLLDWDGSLSAAIGLHQRMSPDATFDEMEGVCIPHGRDGEINVVAVSPRHLEACLTRTGQILVEGEYNGVLRPHEHYIPLARDFSNLDQVFEKMDDEAGRLAMVDRAYRDVVASGDFTYRRMVEQVVSAVPDARRVSDSGGITRAVYLMLNRIGLIFDIAFLFVLSRGRDVRDCFRRAVRGRSG